MNTRDELDEEEFKEEVESSEYHEYKSADDSQRYSDHQSDNNRPY